MGGDTVWKAQCVESETDEQIWEITTAAPTPRNPYKATLTVNGTPLTMVIDTGALIPRRPCFPNCPQLCTYAAEPIGIVRQAKVTVGYKNYIVRGEGPTLLKQAPEYIVLLTHHLQVRRLQVEFAEPYSQAVGLVHEQSRVDGDLVVTTQPDSTTHTGKIAAAHVAWGTFRSTPASDKGLPMDGVL